jgi:hypothetical protein
VALLLTMWRRLLVRRRPRKGRDWGYTAQDLEGARWTMAKELSEDRLWLKNNDNDDGARTIN